MKAVGNNIIIKPLRVTSTEKTKGGLLLIEKDREDIRYQQAIIVSVSNDIKGLKEKDEIYYDKRAGFGIEFNKEKFTVIRKWACRNNNLNDADLELLIYFDCMGLFSKQDFKVGTYAYSWDNRRWNKMIKSDWIVVWRKRNRTTQKYHIYKVSFKCKQLIARMYRIMLGDEDVPMSKKRNKIMRGETYMDKVLINAIKNVNNDKTR